MTIERLAHGGEGVGKLADGRVCFVMFTAPGDRVVARIVEDKRRYARGELVRVLSPGADRALAPCPYFERCGGCQWQHVALPAQRAAKQAVVARALGAAEPIVAAGPDYGYRTRARLGVGPGQLGYRAWRSHDLVDIERCLLLAEALDRGVQALRPELGPDGELEALLGTDGSFAARQGARSFGADVCDLADPGEPPFLGAASAFAQANPFANRALRELVRRASQGARRVLELYAGSGNFTRDLVALAEHVTAVESDPAALALLRGNLAAHLGRVELVSRSVEAALRTLSGPFDLIVMDPPRTGLGDALPAALARLRPARLVYVSCDPQTLGRDVTRLVALGFRLLRATPVDAWPQTFHVETVAELEG